MVTGELYLHMKGSSVRRGEEDLTPPANVKHLCPVQTETISTYTIPYTYTIQQQDNSIQTNTILKALNSQSDESRSLPVF